MFISSLSGRQENLPAWKFPTNMRHRHNPGESVEANVLPFVLQSSRCSYLRVWLLGSGLLSDHQSSVFSLLPWLDSQTGSFGWCGCTKEAKTILEKARSLQWINHFKYLFSTFVCFYVHLHDFAARTFPGSDSVVWPFSLTGNSCSTLLILFLSFMQTVIWLWDLNPLWTSLRLLWCNGRKTNCSSAFSLTYLARWNHKRWSGAAS